MELYINPVEHFFPTCGSVSIEVNETRTTPTVEIARVKPFMLRVPTVPRLAKELILRVPRMSQCNHHKDKLPNQFVHGLRF